MLDYFKKNIETLSRHTTCPLPETLPDNISVQTAASGHTTVKFGDMLIHSIYDPVKEGQTFAKNIPSGSVICLYGFGLGYHIAALLDKIGPDGSLLVIELNPALLASAMILRDQSGILSDKRMQLIYGDNEALVAAQISKHMNQAKDRSPENSLIVLFHSPSFKCIPKNFERIGNALEILQMERRVPAIFGDIEADNYFFNQEIVSQSRGINSLRHTHDKQAAILISAGPSLDDVLPYLSRIGKHLILACVDTALPILSREGIVPKYVFTLDPQEESFAYFRENLNHPAKLIYLPTSNATVVHSYQGEKIVVYKEDHSLFKGKEDQMTEKGTTRAGGSVSCLGLDCLLQMGCNPIFLAGQDCAFSGERAYSRHALINDTFIDRIYLATTLASQHKDIMYQKKVVPVDCHNTGRVFTNQMMYSYLRNIEVLSQAGTQIYNLCSHGALIENATDLKSINEVGKIVRT